MPSTSDPSSSHQLRLIDAACLQETVSMGTAIKALQQALRAGLDPEAGASRSIVPVTHGQLLLMPAESARYAGAKILGVAPGNAERGLPRIQGQYLLFTADTLTPIALVDGAALTTLRTAAVSGAAVGLLAPAAANTLAILGTGPQAHSHLAALTTVRSITQVTVIGRTAERSHSFAAAYADVGGPTVVPGAIEAIAEADVVACCTSARTPLFDGGLLAPHATVVAMGAHEPDAREIDDETVRTSTVVVEARSAALSEAGAVVLPQQAGVLHSDDLVPLAELVRGGMSVGPGGRSVFVSVGMPWEDLVVAGVAYEALA